MTPTPLYLSSGSGPAAVPGSRIPLGRTNPLRKGSDVTVISHGKPAIGAIGVADTLANHRVSPGIIDPRTSTPLDERTVPNSAAKTGRAVPVHEAVQRSKHGAEVAARIHEELFGDLAGPGRPVGSTSCPVPHSTPLQYSYLYGAAGIGAAVRHTLD